MPFHLRLKNFEVSPLIFFLDIRFILTYIPRIIYKNIHPYIHRELINGSIEMQRAHVLRDRFAVQPFLGYFRTRATIFIGKNVP